MCGIAATFGTQDAQTLECLLTAIAHRGPDERAIWRNGCNGIGIQRLSIMDVSSGSQPFVDQARKTALVCNGEIYNSSSLQLAFQADLVSKSDVEVILPMYNSMGHNFLPLLDGMFAVILFDGVRNTFLAARDRFGIKPLFYSHHGSSWVFASEVKAFSEAGLNIGDVKEVPAGHFATPQGIFPWYVATNSLPRADPDPKLLRALLLSSVKKHLQADRGIRIGVLLSGGLDSSIICALAASQRKDIVAFTIGMTGSSDVTAARCVAQHLHIPLVVCPFDLETAAQAISQAVRVTESYNTATVFEGYLTMILAEAAKRHGVKILLSGEGADEIFAGYGFMRHLNQTQISRAQKELLRNIGSTECKRLDRATMAHSVEARVPFLDPLLVDWVMSLPRASLLNTDSDGQVSEKWILRSACADLLPEIILQRKKLALDDGSGITQLVYPLTREISFQDVAIAQSRYPNAGITDKVSLYLYQLWLAHFRVPSEVETFMQYGLYPLMQACLQQDLYAAGGTGEVGDELMALNKTNHVQVLHSHRSSYVRG